MSRSPRTGNSAPPTTGQGEEAIAGQSGTYHDRVKVAAAIAGDPSHTHRQGGYIYSKQHYCIHQIFCTLAREHTYLLIIDLNFRGPVLITKLNFKLVNQNQRQITLMVYPDYFQGNHCMQGEQENSIVDTVKVGNLQGDKGNQPYTHTCIHHTQPGQRQAADDILDCRAAH